MMFYYTARRIRERLGLSAFYRAIILPTVRHLFFDELVRCTGNFSGTTWLGKPIWQNVLDLWVIQETLWEIRPDLLIECGTNRGGSAYFYAQLFDLIGAGAVLTIDVEKLHDLTHPRMTCLLGSSADDSVVSQVRQRVASTQGPIMVILDSDHSSAHVRAELDIYSGFVTVGSFLLVQDGIIDELPRFRADRPGPLPAIKAFLAHHPEFVVDRPRSDRFLIIHHPMGWLRRRDARGGAQA
jgi:cephalosporin hydroxylase